MASTLTPSNYREKMAEAGRRDDALYERYGKALEAEHTGDYVVISEDGDVIVGTDELALTSQAIQQFGPGRFAFRRIGWDYEGRIRFSGR
jgi:hypothetical protein